MARDTSPIVKQSRREGYALHPKAHKIMARKSGIPGEHAHGRQSKPSMYQTQLREKQKVRRLYGLLERQFAKLMKEASRRPGLSGENLLELLERRLDNAVYRAGFAVSRRGARQLVSHGHFELNARRSASKPATSSLSDQRALNLVTLQTSLMSRQMSRSSHSAG